MSKYQAIVFDLDGTAVPNERGGMPSARVIEAVNQNRDRIHLIAATGRPVRYAVPVIEALGLTNPCVVSGGTIILDPTTSKILKLTPLPHGAVQAVFEAVLGHDYALVLREERVDVSAGARLPSISDEIEIIFVGLVPPPDVAPLTAALERIPGIIASIVPDWTNNGTFAFNITHVDATKEHAVADVLQRLGVPQEAAIGIGDGDNDLHLFKSVGLKIAMGNASDTLKAAADLVAPSIDDDGLADIIERYAASR